MEAIIRFSEGKYLVSVSIPSIRDVSLYVDTDEVTGDPIQEVIIDNGNIHRVKFDSMDEASDLYKDCLNKIEAFYNRSAK